MTEFEKMQKLLKDKYNINIAKAPVGKGIPFEKIFGYTFKKEQHTENKRD